MALVRQKGYKLENIDSTICLQKPKIKGLVPEMQSVIANCLEVENDQISIKATTTERLGFVGEEKGISAHAVVLISK